MLDNHLKFPNALPKGYKLEHYHIIQTLAEDNMSLTYLASTAQQEIVTIVEYLPKHLALRDKNNNRVLLKGPNCKYDYEWGLSHYHHEINALMAIEHPNINTIQACINANNTLYKICAYINGSTLQAYAQNKKFTENEIIMLLEPLLASLSTIHQAGYLHGDLTPSTIALEHDSQQPIITHLGTPKNLFLGHKNSPQPSPTNYTAYEQHHDTKKQGVWTDIYAIGAILYQLTTGIVPTPSIMRINTTLKQNTNDPLVPARLIAQNNYSVRFLTAIDHALQLSVTQRPPSIKAWEEELSILHETLLEDSIKETLTTQTKQKSYTSSPTLSIEKELTIVGLSTANSRIAPPSSINKTQGNNKKYTIIIILTLIALIIGATFYYLKPDKQSDHTNSL
jgi:serine/threonine protein kinase